jgi:hypothetical protein
MNVSRNRLIQRSRKLASLADGKSRASRNAGANGVLTAKHALHHATRYDDAQSFTLLCEAWGSRCWILGHKSTLPSAVTTMKVPPHTPCEY